jgi:hypothetical protein
MPSVGLAADRKKRQKAKWFNATEPGMSAYIGAPGATHRPGILSDLCLLFFGESIPSLYLKNANYLRNSNPSHEVKLDPEVQDKSLSVCCCSSVNVYNPRYSTSIFMK